MKSLVALRSRALFVIALAVLVGGCATAGGGDELGDDDGGTASGDDASTGGDSATDSGSYDTPDSGARDGAASTDSGGQADSGHLDSGGTVDSGGGQDSATQTCTVSNCASGCCNGNSCVTAASDSQCGQGGIVCADCTQSGETCNQGFCGTGGGTTACVNGTCAGCCDANNNCLAGTSDTSCGTASAACEDCTTIGFVCDPSFGGCFIF